MMVRGGSMRLVTRSIFVTMGQILKDFFSERNGTEGDHGMFDVKSHIHMDMSLLHGATTLPCVTHTVQKKSLDENPFNG